MFINIRNALFIAQELDDMKELLQEIEFSLI